MFSTASEGDRTERMQEESKYSYLDVRSQTGHLFLHPQFVEPPVREPVSIMDGIYIDIDM